MDWIENIMLLEYNRIIVKAKNSYIGTIEEFPDIKVYASNINAIHVLLTTSLYFTIEYKLQNNLHIPSPILRRS